MNLSIRPVRSKKDLAKFVRMPWMIYRGDPNWVPPLIHDQMNMFNPQKGSFFEFGKAELFIAYDGDKPVGRISAHVDYQYEKFRDQETGRFGFFESVPEQKVADLLFATAESWLREQRKTRVEGPYNFTLYDASGMLYQGFDTLPVVLLTYNPPYYNDMVAACGYEKAIDWYAFMVRNTVNIRPAFLKIRDRVMQQGIEIIKLDLKRMDEAVGYIGEIFNEAWSGNWGHVPFTQRQIEDMAKELKAVVEPELTYLAFERGRCIGFSLSVKDANPALQKANGHLFPFGLIKILLAMRKIHRLRTVAMGVLKEYRHRGLDMLFYVNTIEEGMKLGYTESECSVIVETNDRMIGALEDLQAERYKTYRFYQKNL
ncbi:MAG: N-acetyltransferase [Calditrichaeota bacterium]|nr:MAG: N-acetyltransferase [Calditrichota bacterium]